MYREQLSPVRGALPVDPLELRGVRQAHTLASRHPSDCQALPAPATPGRDDPASSDGAHPIAKAVGLRPLASVRLVRTLHDTPLQVFQDVQGIPGSISEPPKPIQPDSHTSGRVHLPGSAWLPQWKYLQNVF